MDKKIKNQSSVDATLLLKKKEISCGVSFCEIKRNGSPFFRVRSSRARARVYVRVCYVYMYVYTYMHT